MDRRAFLFSTASLALAPAQNAIQTGADPLAGGDPAANDTIFSAWRAAFLATAEARGLPRDKTAEILADLTPDPSVAVRDQRQPEFSLLFSRYVETTVSESRIDDGKAMRASTAPWLDPIAAEYGVTAQIILSIWGIESGYGQHQGEDDVIRSLATLAAEGRRRAFFEDELAGALKILFSGAATRDQLKGSWAGAMGQTQFTPLDYLAYAVDGDGDGRADIWGSAPDALASSANFLLRKGRWRPGQRPQQEVFLPTEGFDYSLLEGPALTPSQWSSLGVQPAPAPPFTADELETQTSLFAPMGWKGPAFLAFPNHAAIKAYNNSTAYALSVGLLADRIGGAGPLAQAWPEDAPISLADRLQAQQALSAMGYYTGQIDGLLGASTRKAARLWQARKGLPADGYLSNALVQELKADAPATPSQALAGASAGAT